MNVPAIDARAIERGVHWLSYGRIEHVETRSGWKRYENALIRNLNNARLDWKKLSSL
jgi:hypothetical protein